MKGDHGERSERKGTSPYPTTPYPAPTHPVLPYTTLPGPYTTLPGPYTTLPYTTQPHPCATLPHPAPLSTRWPPESHFTRPCQSRIDSPNSDSLVIIPEALA